MAIVRSALVLTHELPYLLWDRGNGGMHSAHSPHPY